jgi:hypothetical protein
MELTASRRTIQLYMSSTRQLLATLVPARSSSSGLVRPMIVFAAGLPTVAAGGVSAYQEVWLTGQMIFGGKNVLLFRADQPVEANRTGPFVNVRLAKQARNILLLMYMKAAETHMKLRLYGQLVPEPSHKNLTLPGMRFVTWKAHLPDDPDNLPLHDTLFFGSDEALPGYKVQIGPSQGPNQAMEPTASRRTIQLCMSSIRQFTVTRALARSGSSCSR